MKFRAGEILNGRYEILGEIGEGGFAVVYRARDHELSRDIAIKVMKSCGTINDLQRFQREAKLLAQLVHKNIITVFSYDLLDNSIPYITMEYLQGKSLQAVLQESGKLSIEFVMDILFQCCQGLSFAHNAGIVHRDLSPANIFAVNSSAQPQVKILDFGLSKLLFAEQAKTLTETGMLVGNPHYMSPELTGGEQADARTDIYALGCILYECLSGEKVFSADEALGLIYLHKHEYPKQPKFECDDTEKANLINLIMLACLQKDPSKRFQSCTQILDSLSGSAKTKSLCLPVNLDSWADDKDTSKLKKAPKNAKLVLAGSAAVLCMLFVAVNVVPAVTVRILVATHASFLEPVEVAIANHLIKTKQGALAAELLEHLCSEYRNRGENLKLADCLLKKANLGLNLSQDGSAPDGNQKRFEALQCFVDAVKREKDSKERSLLVTQAWQVLEKNKISTALSNQYLSLENRILQLMLTSHYCPRSDFRHCLDALVKMMRSTYAMDDSTLRETTKTAKTAIIAAPGLSDSEFGLLMDLLDECCQRGLLVQAQDLCRTILSVTTSERTNARFRLAELFLDAREPDEVIRLLEIMKKDTDWNEMLQSKICELEAVSYFMKHNFSESLRLCNQGLALIRDDSPHTLRRTSLTKWRIYNLFAIGRNKEAEYELDKMIDDLMSWMNSVSDADESSKSRFDNEVSHYIHGNYNYGSPKGYFLRAWLDVLHCLMDSRQTVRAKFMLKALQNQIRTRGLRFDHAFSRHFSRQIEICFARQAEEVHAPDCLALIKEILKEGGT